MIGFKGEIIVGNINDKSLLKRLEEEYCFNYIFHQAAISDTTVEEQDTMLQTNVSAFEDLLKIAIKHNAKMIYASSASTYGNGDKFEIGYEMPNNIYGFSKNMMDNITLKHIKNNQEISIIGLRYFNVYGPKEFFKGKTASMILQFGHQILKGQTPKLFVRSDSILRDFVYVEDIIQANVQACTANKSGVYNVGTGNARSFEDVVNILQKELEIDNGKDYIDNPYVGKYQFYTQANIQTTTDDLDFRPQYNLEDGIKNYIPEIKNTFKDLT